jgi:hypothetical protein
MGTVIKTQNWITQGAGMAAAEARALCTGSWAGKEAVGRKLRLGPLANTKKKDVEWGRGGGCRGPSRTHTYEKTTLELPRVSPALLSRGVDRHLHLPQASVSERECRTTGGAQMHDARQPTGCRGRVPKAGTTNAAPWGASKRDGPRWPKHRQQEDRGRRPAKTRARWCGDNQACHS